MLRLYLSKVIAYTLTERPRNASLQHHLTFNCHDTKYRILAKSGSF